MIADKIRMISYKINESTSPCDIVLGAVSGISPLTVEVEVGGKLSYSGDTLIVPRHLLAGENVSHTHTILPHTHTIGKLSTEKNEGKGDEQHLHEVAELATNEAELSTQTVINTGLAVGDTVVMLRGHGGQQCVMLGAIYESFGGENAK